MKVLRFDTETRVAHVQLTRRNLRTLLAKLGSPLNARTLEKHDTPGTIIVTAVEDEVYYSGQVPGHTAEELYQPDDPADPETQFTETVPTLCRRSLCTENTYTCREGTQHSKEGEG